VFFVNGFLCVLTGDCRACNRSQLYTPSILLWFFKTSWTICSEKQMKWQSWATSWKFKHIVRVKAQW